MNRVIFLDIDGVLVTRDELRIASATRAPFKRSAVAALNRITTETGASIVVSSSWRKVRPIEAIREKFLDEGVKGAVADSTPSLERVTKTGVYTSVQRWCEIQAWLEQNWGPARDSGWAAIDDESDARHPDYPHRFVRTEGFPGPGLTDYEADRVISILTDA